MIKCICDKCGAEIKHNLNDNKYPMGYGKRYEITKYEQSGKVWCIDLCDKCTEEFEDWLMPQTVE